MSNLWLLFVSIGSYILLLIVTRRAWILRRNTEYLLFYLSQLEARKAIDSKKNTTSAQPSNAEVLVQIDRLMKEAKEMVDPENCQLFKSFRLLPDGQEKQLSAWRKAHEADQLLTELWSDQQITAHATVAKGELNVVNTATANALAEKIIQELSKGTPANLRTLVTEARGLIFNARDDYFEGLSDWQNKALWLIFMTVIIVTLLAITHEKEMPYMLLGATGGLLVRLAKAINTKNIVFDYGVSWSMLFLAPIVGALMGWTGVLISEFVATLDVLNLPQSMIQATCKLENGKEVIVQIADNAKNVLAVLFGFSATFFERVMSGAITALTKKIASSN